ncbi:hypothetical protein BDQ17DRAFT_1351523 [Cyathus striatus]|nr:hypothetical protein BDQ17DRAFT_1351523 [Cyathus striatus]
MTKYYIPLESNPEVFTHLLRSLGVQSLSFTDVYSVDDPDLVSLIPRPVYALVFIFPDVTKEWQECMLKRENARDEYTGSGDGEDVIWFHQTIRNACGLYAILHSICNGDARAHIEPNTPISTLLTKAVPLSPAQRAKALEEDTSIERAHHEAAIQGSSAVPEADANVNYRYIAYVKSKNGHLYEMDGSSKGPIDLGIIGEDKRDVLDAARSAVKEHVQREEGNIHFSLIALVPGED